MTAHRSGRRGGASLTWRTVALVSGIACVQGSPPPERPKAPVDPALVEEQRRRIAAFDSVVRLVNTDSAYKLWHAMLTAPDIRVTQLAVMCEYQRLGDIYGRAADDALERMRDTLWRDDDLDVVARMDQRMAGESPAMTRNSCGARPTRQAAKWLAEWWVPELPQLPPSPDSSEAPR